MSGVLNSPEVLVEVSKSLFNVSKGIVDGGQLFSEELHLVGTDAVSFLVEDLEESELLLDGSKSLNLNINFLNRPLVFLLFLGMSSFLSLSESQVANLRKQSEEGIEVDVFVDLSFVGNLLIDFSLFGLSTFTSNLLHHLFNNLLLEGQVVEFTDGSVKIVDGLEEILSVADVSRIRVSSEELSQRVEQENANFFVTVVTDIFSNSGKLVRSDTLELLHDLLEKTLFDFL